MEKIVIIIVFVLFSFETRAQVDFELDVNVSNLSVKTLSISKVLDDNYYKEFFLYPNKIIDDQYHFSGKIAYPYLCEFVIDSMAYSSNFLIYPGVNNVKLMFNKGIYEVVRTDDHRSDHFI